MIFRNPEVEIITEENPLKRVEIAGRVCYKSEDKITEDSAIAFVKKLIKIGHTSPLEHARIVIPATYYEELENNTWCMPYGYHDRLIYTSPGHEDSYGIIHSDSEVSINLRDYWLLVVI